MSEGKAAHPDLESASTTLEQGLEKCHELVVECRARLLSLREANDGDADGCAGGLISASAEA